MKYQYEIELDVPLGLRQGTMQFESRDGVVKGTMYILGCESTFGGFLRKSEIELSGELKTSVRNIEYHGTGTISEEGIQMQLRSVNRTYKLKGVCLQKEKLQKS